jgi:glutamyl-tRNA synthetase
MLDGDWSSDVCSSDLYFADDFVVDEKPLAKNVIKYPELKEWLPMLGDRFAALPDFSLEATEATARELAAELNVKPGVIINGMRTVATGQLAGPSMFDVVLAIGKERIVARLRGAGKFFA